MSYPQELIELLSNPCVDNEVCKAWERQYAEIRDLNTHWRNRAEPARNTPVQQSRVRTGRPRLQLVRATPGIANPLAELGRRRREAREGLEAINGAIAVAVRDALAAGGTLSACAREVGLSRRGLHDLLDRYPTSKRTTT